MNYPYFRSLLRKSWLLNQGWKISLDLRIDFLGKSPTPQAFSLYVRIHEPETLITSLFKFHLMRETTRQTSVGS